jgi:WD40 repeat protein
MWQLYRAIALWEADSGKLVVAFQGDSAVFSPDCRRVLTASGDKTARLWEADSGKLLATFQGHTDQARLPEQRIELFA